MAMDVEEADHGAEEDGEISRLLEYDTYLHERISIETVADCTLDCTPLEQEYLDTLSRSPLMALHPLHDAQPQPFGFPSRDNARSDSNVLNKRTNYSSSERVTKRMCTEHSHSQFQASSGALYTY